MNTYLSVSELLDSGDDAAQCGLTTSDFQMNQEGILKALCSKGHKVIEMALFNYGTMTGFRVSREPLPKTAAADGINPP